MKVSIQMISLGPHELFFLFDHQHLPVIKVHEVQYHSVGALLQTFPHFYHPNHFDKLAQIANFLARGLEFQYIEDIESFKDFYYQQIEAEQSSLLYEGSSLKDYGIFDLSVMHAPQLKDQQLIFYVKHDYLSLPYQVTLFDPLNHLETPNMNYELLPLVSYSSF